MHRALVIPDLAQKLADEGNFEVKGYSIDAHPEECRPPRLVRIGAIQNKIVLPTTAPVSQQREALHQRIEQIVNAASLCGINIICLQECWSTFS